MYGERFDEALVFASQIHREQVRKGSGIPYVIHLLAVTSLVGEHGGTEDQVIAALLHDAIEDCIGEIPDIAEQIEARFGTAVYQIVDGCTDSKVDPKPPWRERKEGYLARLRAKPDDSPVLLVSCADKVHNAGSILRDYRAIGDRLWSRFRGGRDGTLWYYRELADTFTAKKPGSMSKELRRVVDAIHRVAE